MTAIAAARASAQQSDLASVIAAYAGAHGFNGTILVARGGAVLYHESSGLADRTFGIPAAGTTRCRIASITKLFTSTLVLQHVERGEVDLDRVVHTYLPAYKGEGGPRVTVRQLLNHTSGIQNFDTVTSYEQAIRDGIPQYQLPQTSDNLLNRFSSGRLVREPGTAFDYNYADYIILGKIIEAVSGKTFDAVLHERILDPLGMRDTGLLRQQEVVAHLAPTYWKDKDQPLINDMPVYMQNWYAAGGMYSTTSDLLLFANALYGGGLLKPDTLALMLTPGLDDYGFGLWAADVKIKDKPHRVAQRPGSIMGANTTLLRFLDDDVTVVILGNTNQTDIDAFGWLIGRTVASAEARDN